MTHSPYLMSMCTRWGNLVGQVVAFNLGLFGVVAKSPIVGSGEPPVVRSLFLYALMTSK